MRALRVFGSQIVGAIVTVAGFTWWYALDIAGAKFPVLGVPVAISTVVVGLLTFVTTMGKTVKMLDGNGWAEYPPAVPCRKCTALQLQLTETRQALATLEVT